MSLRTRRVLYISAIVLFFVTAPLLVLYTAGFRFDFAKRTLRPTGSLFIKTLPEDVDVFINEELVDDTTPLRLNHLTPSTYAIRITKDGYDSWYKNLDVRVQETTFAENIILWKQNPSQEVLYTGGIENFWINSENTHILYKTSQAIVLQSTDSKDATTIIDNFPTSTPVTVHWSHTGSHALVHASSSYWIITAKDQTATPLLDTAESITEARFHPSNPQIITYNTPKGVFAYMLNTQATSTLLDFPVQSYLLHDSDIYYMTGPNPTLLTRAPRNVNDTPPIFELPDSENLQLQDVIDNLIFVYNEPEQLLYTLRLEPDSFNQQSHIFPNVTTWEIDESKEKLLLQNDLEVIVVNMPEFTEQTIARVSTPIQHVAWYHDDNYVLIVYPNKLELTELDRRDYRNTSTVWEQSVLKAVLAQDGEHIFVLTNTEDTTQLLKIKVTDLSRSFFSF